MSSEKFTIIIPTRERADTLFWALKTCVAQNYDNLEIIVSDNFSRDNTRDVVESFGDKRIKYINTNERLSMSLNWEFALSHVSEGYVSIIGDDDGFLPDSVKEAAGIISGSENPDSLTWRYAYYFWPNYILDDLRNSLTFPLEKNISLKNSTDELARLARSEIDYFALPGLYNSFISYRLIKKVIEKSGKFFCSSIPDAYSAVAIGSVTNNFLYSQRPFGIAGISSHSIGSSFINAEVAGESKKRFLEEKLIPFHPKVAMCSSNPFLIAESFLQAIDNNLLPADYPLSIKDPIRAGLAAAQTFSPARFEEIVAASRETARLNGLDDWVENEISGLVNKPADAEKRPVVSYDGLSNVIHLKMDTLGVENIYDASLLVKQLVVMNESNLIVKRSQLKHLARQSLKAVGETVLPTKTYVSMKEKFRWVFK